MQVMEIGINEVWDPEHSKAIDRDNYNISRTCDETINNMHHIHHSYEILLVEDGAAFYYLDGKPYYLEAGDVLVIGAFCHHQRVIHKLPFQRYGLTIRPSYFKSLLLENDLLQVMQTPTEEQYNLHYKHIDPDVFQMLIVSLRTLKTELCKNGPYRSLMERTLITQIAVLLFREFRFKRDTTPLPAAHAHMLEIKEYIDTHYAQSIDLKSLSEKFFLHPATISKDFHKCCGHNLSKYINMVRISEAAKLLETTNHTIAFISEKCGYDSDNTFLRQFKSIMEISPSQYRKATLEISRKVSHIKLET